MLTIQPAANSMAVIIALPITHFSGIVKSLFFPVYSSKRITKQIPLTKNIDQWE